LVLKQFYELIWLAGGFIRQPNRAESQTWTIALQDLRIKYQGIDSLPAGSRNRSFVKKIYRINVPFDVPVLNTLPLTGAVENLNTSIFT